MKTNLLLCMAGTLALLATSGCGSGTSAGIPLVKPIVQAATPDSLETFTAARSNVPLVTGLSLGAERSLSCTSGTPGYSLINSLACRLFTTGPANIYDIVAAIDNRLKEINNRSAESTRTCLSLTPVDLTSQFPMPDNATGFPFHAQCYDKFDSTGSILFGKKDDTWYLQDRSSGAASIVKVTGSNAMEGYFIVGMDNSPYNSATRSVMHFKADSGAATFEFSVAGLNVGFCSSIVIGNGTNIWIKGEDNDSVGNTACAALTEKCASAADLTEAASGNCTALAGTKSINILGRTASTGGYVGAASAESTFNPETPFTFGISDPATITGVQPF